jgi:hypothetical protein
MVRDEQSRGIRDSRRLFVRVGRDVGAKSGATVTTVPRLKSSSSLILLPRHSSMASSEFTTTIYLESLASTSRLDEVF